uniref:Uncharacterized protein n=1 Tax=Thermogemmatispora argillosa TaxID=2045280 RepID=A0A455T4B6_9CHLR|nr:hypothetical protein KTA_29770 [Thermogemmatispora argillosa]
MSGVASRSRLALASDRLAWLPRSGYQIGPVRWFGVHVSKKDAEAQPAKQVAGLEAGALIFFHSGNDKHRATNQPMAVMPAALQHHGPLFGLASFCFFAPHFFPPLCRRICQVAESLNAHERPLEAVSARQREPKAQPLSWGKKYAKLVWPL